MSDRVEDRRNEEVYEQKRATDVRTAKQKEEAAQKFRTAILARAGEQQKTQAVGKEMSQKQQSEKRQGENAMLAKMGIANRSTAERLMKSRDEARTAGKDNEKVAAEGRSDREDRETLRSDEKRQERVTLGSQNEHGQQQEGGFDQGQPQEQGQGFHQGGGQQGQGQGQQRDREQKERNDKDGAVSGIGGTKQAAAASATTAASASTNAKPAGTKIAIGKTQQIAAAERISQPVLQSLVEKIWAGGQQGMSEFQVQLKDDVLGGGSLRVTLKGGKLKLSFTMKQASAKNLLESSRGVLLRMFEKKGLTLESFEVMVRGQASL